VSAGPPGPEPGCRGGARELTLSAGPAAGFAVDLLIAAGRVRRARLPSVTFEQLGMAPAFRAAVQDDALELVECDEPSLVGGYQVAAAGLPSLPVQSLVGTELAGVRPDLISRDAGGGRSSPRSTESSTTRRSASTRRRPPCPGTWSPMSWRHRSAPTRAPVTAWTATMRITCAST
jgi:hypothetical protein